MNETHETVKHLLDGLSVVTVVATLMNIFPAIAAILSIVWSIIRIYETATVQKLLGNKPDKGVKDAIDN